VEAQNVSIIIKNRKISTKIVKNGTVPVKTNQNIKSISTHIPAIFILQKIQKIHKKIISPNLNSKIKSLDNSNLLISLKKTE
jgi:hypothetical protein